MATKTTSDNQFSSTLKSSRIFYKELTDEMRKTASSVGASSSDSSRKSSSKLASSLEKIRDFCMSTEMVCDFEDPSKFVEKVNTDQLKVCDIIQYKCNGYFHWALYVGDGQIIHFLNTPGGGRVMKQNINYSADNYDCRVNNLSSYANAKGYKERAYSDIMMAACCDLKIGNFNYNLLTNNCGHMVTLWKYGTRFNPEIATHTRIMPLMGAIGGSIIGGVVGYSIKWLPHYCICAIIGAGFGVTVCVGVIGVCFVAGGYLGYKYSETGHRHMHRIYLAMREQTEQTPPILPNALIDPENELRGILMTDSTDANPHSEATQQQPDGNNCEIALYPNGDFVVHLVAEGDHTTAIRHHINSIHQCCNGINHAEIKNNFH